MNKDVGHALFSLALFGSLFLMVLLLFIVAFILLYRQNQLRQEQERKKTAEKNYNDLLQARIEVHEQTLVTIARELHDNIGQELAAANMLLKNYLNFPKEKEEAILLVRQCTGFLDRAFDATRSLSHSFNAQMVDYNGLIASIDMELRSIREYARVDTEFRHMSPYDMPFLNEETQLLLFRIAQESMQNILKHAMSGNMEIVLDRDEEADTLTMSVTDRGIGMDLKTVRKGMGMLNMEHRVGLLGGNLDIISSPGKGTEVRVCIPLAIGTTTNEDFYGKQD